MEIDENMLAVSTEQINSSDTNFQEVHGDQFGALNMFDGDSENQVWHAKSYLSVSDKKKKGKNKYTGLSHLLQLNKKYSLSSRMLILN